MAQACEQCLPLASVMSCSPRQVPILQSTSKRHTVQDMLLIFGACEFNDCTQRNAAGLPNWEGTNNRIAVFRSNWAIPVGFALCHMESVKITLRKWEQRLEAVLSSVANVVALVCKMRIVGCIVLSLHSKLSPGVTKVRYTLSVCLAFSLPLPK